MLRRLVPLLVLAVLPACSDGAPTSRPSAASTGTAPSATPVPDAPATAAPPAAAASARLLLLARESGPLELYGLTGRTAVLVRTLKGPGPEARATSLSLSGGPAPLVCAVWDLDGLEPSDDPQRRLLCYPTESGLGTEIREAGDNVTRVAVRPDAAALTWVDQADNQTLTVGSFRQGRVSGLRRFVADASKPAGSGERSFTGEAAIDLAWSTLDDLVISIGVESDDGPDLRTLALRPGGRGWLAAPRVIMPASEDPYFAYDSVLSASGRTALARMRTSWMTEDEQRPDKAVRIDLGSGAVREVLATAAAGRVITHVSGDAAAVVYRTAQVDAGNAPKVYVRYAGDARGAEIAGLPADVTGVVTAS